MKCKVILKDSNGQTVFKGKAMNMPIKKDAIVKMCIEIFNDDDPCIIHQSYAVNKYVTEFLTLFEKNNTVDISLKPYKDACSFIDIEDICNGTISIEVKK